MKGLINVQQVGIMDFKETDGWQPPEVSYEVIEFYVWREW